MTLLHYFLLALLFISCEKTDSEMGNYSFDDHESLEHTFKFDISKYILDKHQIKIAQVKAKDNLPCEVSLEWLVALDEHQYQGIGCIVDEKKGSYMAKISFFPTRLNKDRIDIKIELFKPLRKKELVVKILHSPEGMQEKFEKVFPTAEGVYKIDE